VSTCIIKWKALNHWKHSYIDNVIQTKKIIDRMSIQKIVMTCMIVTSIGELILISNWYSREKNEKETRMHNCYKTVASSDSLFSQDLFLERQSRDNRGRIYFWGFLSVFFSLSVIGHSSVRPWRRFRYDRVISRNILFLLMNRCEKCSTHIKNSLWCFPPTVSVENFTQ